MPSINPSLINRLLSVSCLTEPLFLCDLTATTNIESCLATSRLMHESRSHFDSSISERQLRRISTIDPAIRARQVPVTDTSVCIDKTLLVLTLPLRRRGAPRTALSQLLLQDAAINKLVTKASRGLPAPA
ncbi:hypothetical protein KCU87_g254, partial [Aureobasidium melanogenum]